MKTTTAGKEIQTQARALLADIEGAPTTSLPRRETIVDWLNAFLVRTDKKGYVLGETEAADLNELDQFLRTYDVPVAAAA
jgi:hypothetical protein